MKNVMKGWKTTIIGCAIIIASIVSVLNNKNMSWADASIPLTIGIALLFSPDTALNKISSVFTKKA